MALQLGASTNALCGLKATTKFTITPAPKSPIEIGDPIVERPKTSNWSPFPTISFHETAEELAGALLRIQFLTPPSYLEQCDVKEASCSLSAFIFAGLTDDAKRTKAVKNIFAEVGLDLGKLSPADCSYALVEQMRLVSTSSHPSAQKYFPMQWLTAEALQALKILQKTENDYGLSKDGANGYLDWFKTFGTHFISSIKSGDKLFQVRTTHACLS
jgi:hypothetical protein